MTLKKWLIVKFKWTNTNLPHNITKSLDTHKRKPEPIYHHGFKAV